MSDDFTWLGFDDRRALADALIAVGLVGDRRSVLLADLDPRFKLQLRNMPDDLAQLQSDLAEIDRVEQLADGRIPMAQLLRRAEFEAQRDPAALATVRRLRARVEGDIAGQPIETPTTVAEVPEAIVHRDDMVDFGFLLRGAAAGRSVARLTVPAWAGGQPIATRGTPRTHRGTGWVVGPGLLMTCHHVIQARPPGAEAPSTADLEQQAAMMTIEFDVYDASVVGHRVDGARLLAWAPAPLDYAILAVPTDDRAPLQLDATPIGADGTLAVNILQHPDGRALMVALRHNIVVGADRDAVRYFTDTLPGASGSPVCDDQWRVRAVHRATRGTAAVFAGKRVQYENVGTPIGTLLADLAARAPAVAEKLSYSRGLDSADSRE